MNFIKGKSCSIFIFRQCFKKFIFYPFGKDKLFLPFSVNMSLGLVFILHFIEDTH